MKHELENTMEATVTGLGVCDLAGRVESRAVDGFRLTLQGIPNDRHYGPTLISGPRQKQVPKGTVLPNTRQVSWVSKEELSQIAQTLELPSLHFTWLAANIEIEGLSRLTQVAPRSRWVFPSGAVLEVEGENEPCRKAGRVIQAFSGQPVESAFVKAAWHRRGLVGFVVAEGDVRVGDRVRVEPPGN